jgi:hypothetical protein
MRIQFSHGYLQAIIHFMSPYESLLLVWGKSAPPNAIECHSEEQYKRLSLRFNDRGQFLSNYNLLFGCLGDVLKCCQ